MSFIVPEEMDIVEIKTHLEEVAGFEFQHIDVVEVKYYSNVWDNSPIMVVGHNYHFDRLLLAPKDPIPHHEYHQKIHDFAKKYSMHALPSFSVDLNSFPEISMPLVAPRGLYKATLKFSGRITASLRGTSAMGDVHLGQIEKSLIYSYLNTYLEKWHCELVSGANGIPELSLSNRVSGNNFDLKVAVTPEIMTAESTMCDIEFQYKDFIFKGQISVACTCQRVDNNTAPPPVQSHHSILSKYTGWEVVGIIIVGASLAVLTGGAGDAVAAALLAT